jgi:hypothetical protein
MCVVLEILLCVRHLTDDLADERLGKMFKAVPPTEDVYVYQNNGPSFDNP